MRAKYYWMIAVLALASFGSSVRAEDVGRFQWQHGQVIQYRIDQRTLATESFKEDKSEVFSRTELTKRWEVTDVDAAGVAMLQMSFTRLAMEQRRPGGKIVKFDSAAPDQADEQLKKLITPMLNKVLVELRVDSTGRVLEVKSSEQGPASRYESELPFALVLPGTPFQANQTWKRSYRIVLDPPLGTGEKFDAEQVYRLKGLAEGQATISLETTIKELPKDPNDQLPLLQLQPKGDVTFDCKRGLMTQASITSGGVIEGHQGEGSRYEFKSEYREQLLPNP